VPRDTWFFDLFVKITPSLTGTETAADNPAVIAVTVPGRAEWLLSSSEREAPEEHGILGVKLKGPAVILPSSDWKMLTFSRHTRRENSH
jgi:hypothetical protein